jgi:crossover junction endodeoxyribonuclease RusA
MPGRIQVDAADLPPDADASSWPTILVPGLPRPAGSHRAFVIAGRARIAPANKEQRSWQRVVSECAAEAWTGREPLLGQIMLTATFLFPHPKSHYRSGVYASQLKPQAPCHNSNKPDLDKLLRAVGDALTGIVWRDDSHVVVVHACKMYTTGGPCASIKVQPLNQPNRNLGHR